MNYFSSFKLIIFDLDNTLILEEDYLFEAYKNIAIYLGEKHLIKYSEIEHYLINQFRQNGRLNLFDKMLNEFDIYPQEIAYILKILREFEPDKKINLIHDMSIILKQLKHFNIPYVILTNGNPVQQKNKINNICWDSLLPDVIYANDIEPKPSTASFMKYLLTSNQTNTKDEILMIGDSVVDKLFAKNFGCKFINVSDILVKIKF